MIHINRLREKLEAVGLSLLVHGSIFAALFYALDAVPSVVVPEQNIVSISLADIAFDGGQTAADTAPATKTVPRETIRQTRPPKAQPVAQPRKTPKPHQEQRPVPRPVRAADSQTAPLPNITPTPEVKMPPDGRAPLPEASLPQPSQAVASAAPGHSSPMSDTSETAPLPAPSKADPTPPGATVLGRIRAMIERAVTYPAVARRLRIEGVVVLSFVLTQEGAVAEAEVIDSSGSALLDRKALETLWQLSGAFPPLESTAHLTIPIAFSLKKS